jgi:hypothetical protein
MRTPLIMLHSLTLASACARAIEMPSALNRELLIKDSKWYESPESYAAQPYILRIKTDYAPLGDWGLVRSQTPADRAKPNQPFYARYYKRERRRR